jgi:hypothetical protein
MLRAFLNGGVRRVRRSSADGAETFRLRPWKEFPIKFKTFKQFMLFKFTLQPFKQFLKKPLRFTPILIPSPCGGKPQGESAEIGRAHV